MSLKLALVTPLGKVLDTEVTQVIAPGAQGEFSVLPSHRPGIALLSGGAIRYEGASSGVIFVRGGVVEIGPDRVLVLAGEAVKAADVDTAAAQRILEKAAADLGTVEFLNEESTQAIETDRRFAEAILSAR